MWCTWNENRCTYVELVGAQGPKTLSCDTEESEIPGLRDGIVVFQLYWRLSRIIYFKVTGVSSMPEPVPGANEVGFNGFQLIHFRYAEDPMVP